MNEITEEYEQLKMGLEKFLLPFLYAAPDMVDTFQQKFSEFYEKKEKGIKYSQDELLKTAFQAAKRLVGYIAKDAGGSGLIRRIAIKHAQEYLADAIVNMFFEE